MRARRFLSLSVLPLAACAVLLVTSLPVAAAAVAVVPGSGGPLPVPPLPGSPRAPGSVVAPVNVLPAGLAGDGEVPSLRTAESRTFAVRGGYRTQLSGSPVNVRAGDGSWQKIDTTLRSMAGGAFAPTVSGVAVALPAVAGGPVTVGPAGSGVSFTLLGVAGNAGVSSGDTVTYPEVLPGVGVRETATASGVKEDVMLASAAAANSVSERVGLPAGAALTVQPGGSVVVTASGSRLGVITTPVVTDARGVVSQSAVRWSLTGPDVLTVTVDPGWLSAAGRVFPVTVDPSYTPSGGSDTQIEGGSQQNVNYGSASVVCAGVDAGHAGAPARGLYSFTDLGAGIPRDAQVTGAQLGLSVASLSAATTGRVRWSV